MTIMSHRPKLSKTLIIFNVLCFKREGWMVKISEDKKCHWQNGKYLNSVKEFIPS